MAAPKQWGYTREHPITDELLVSWTDGDLTEILVKELEERLLADPAERAMVAAFARAGYEASVGPKGKRDWIADVPDGLMKAAKTI